MAALLDFLRQLIQFFITASCYDEIFVRHNFFHVECLKLIASKVIGYGIILGSLLVKIPQIFKIVKAKSGRGINLFSVSMELAAITASACYGYAARYPFSAYGESIFLALQTSLIGFYVLYYQRKRTQAFTYITVYGAIFALLLSPIVPFKVLSVLQMSVIPVICISKLVQAYENFKNKNTGQLSAVTIFLLFVGALARVFTSIQETGDNLLVVTYIVSTCLNGLIASQILYYWKSPAHAGKRSGKRKNKKS